MAKCKLSSNVQVLKPPLNPNLYGARMPVTLDALLRLPIYNMVLAYKHNFKVETPWKHL